MSPRRAALPLLADCFLQAPRLPAQPGPETLVPFDPGGRLERVDAALAQKLGMFAAGHPGFEEARLW